MQLTWGLFFLPSTSCLLTLDLLTSIWLCQVPRKQNILLSMYNLHRSPAVWENPEDFIPERFPINEPIPNEVNTDYKWVQIKALKSVPAAMLAKIQICSIVHCKNCVCQCCFFERMVRNNEKLVWSAQERIFMIPPVFFPSQVCSLQWWSEKVCRGSIRNDGSSPHPGDHSKGIELLIGSKSGDWIDNRGDHSHNKWTIHEYHKKIVLITMIGTPAILILISFFGSAEWERI